MKTGRPKISQSKIIENFELRINKNPTVGNTDCWVWTGSATPNGYGQFSCGNYKTILAHRFAYSLWIGEIQDGKLVCHSCDNKWCVNPKHLFLGSEKDNIQDAIIKRRLRFGEIHHNSKMTDTQVASCRSKWRSSADTRSLASEFGVSRSTIQRIVGLKSRTIPTSETIYAQKLFTK